MYFMFYWLIKLYKRWFAHFVLNITTFLLSALKRQLFFADMSANDEARVTPCPQQKYIYIFYLSRKLKHKNSYSIAKLWLIKIIYLRLFWYTSKYIWKKTPILSSIQKVFGWQNFAFFMAPSLMKIDARY